MPVPGIDEQPILRRHRREIGRAFVCACFALFMMLSLAVAAVAEGERYVVPGNEVVVSFPRSPTSRGAARSISRLKVPKHLRLEPVKGSHSIGVASVATSVVAQSTAPVLVNDAEISAVCSAIRRANPNVEVLCEANTLFFADIVPNDPDYSSLYGLDIINAPAAWNHSTGSSSVVVAVLDTGVDYQHPDLSANIHTNGLEVPNNGIDDDGNGYIDDYYGFDFAYDDSNPMDVHGHGTHCAGTIGARGNNAIGIVGVNWQVGILPVKVLLDTGSGYLSDIVAGIDFAVARGASVISMSLSGSSTSATMETAIQNALNQDVLIVAAAGNNATNNDTTPRYPASSTKENVIAVAATNQSDGLAYFSNYGITSVDLAAPGVSIRSTLPGNTYTSLSGTSMATPHVAGLAALLKAVDSSLTYSQVKDALFSTVDPLAALAGKCVTGGRINAAAAVQSVMPVSTATATATATASATATATSTATLTATATPTGTPSATPTVTATPTSTQTSTPISSATSTPTTIATPSATATPTPTFTATRTAVPIDTPMPTYTNTPAPSPTAAPTRTSPSVPTATPTPIFTDPPPEPITEPNNITFFIQRERRRAYLFGEVTDPDDQPVVGSRVWLVCGGQEIASVLTEEEGYYEFIRRRPSRPINCYVKDADEGRSKTRKLR